VRHADARRVRLRPSPTTRRNAVPARPVGPVRSRRPPPPRGRARTPRPRPPRASSRSRAAGQREGTASGPAWGSPDSSTRSPQKTISGEPVAGPLGSPRSLRTRTARSWPVWPGPTFASRTRTPPPRSSVHSPETRCRGRTRRSAASAASPGSAPLRTASARNPSCPFCPSRPSFVGEHPLKAHRPEDLDPRERRRAEDVVEVRVGEREMGDPPAPEQPPRLRTQPRALPQPRPRVDHERRTLAHHEPGRAVPHRKPAPPHPRTQFLPPGLFPSHPHTPTLALRPMKCAQRRTAVGTERDSPVHVAGHVVATSQARPCPGRTYRPYTWAGDAGTRAR
jgi:hypothetical protein